MSEAELHLGTHPTDHLTWTHTVCGIVGGYCSVNPPAGLGLTPFFFLSGRNLALLPVLLGFVFHNPKAPFSFCIGFEFRGNNQ